MDLDQKRTTLFRIYGNTPVLSPRPLPARRAYRPEGRLSEPEASAPSLHHSRKGSGFETLFC